MKAHTFHFNSQISENDGLFKLVLVHDLHVVMPLGLVVVKRTSVKL